MTSDTPNGRQGSKIPWIGHQIPFGCRQALQKLRIWATLGLKHPGRPTDIDNMCISAPQQQVIRRSNKQQTAMKSRRMD
jgi:hypothetical protein